MVRFKNINLEQDRAPSSHIFLHPHAVIFLQDRQYASLMHLSRQLLAYSKDDFSQDEVFVHEHEVESTEESFSLEELEVSLISKDLVNEWSEKLEFVLKGFISFS